MTAALHTGPLTHLDHLGVLAQLLNIPLLVTDESHLTLCRTYYPEIQASYVPLEALTLPFLAERFNLLLTCGKFWVEELQELFRLLLKKEMRFALCPHGNSDKGFTLTDHPRQDIALIYGKQMYDQLQTTGALSKIAFPLFTGNYRREFFKEKSTFYDAIVQPLLKGFDSSRKTIFFAPTWKSEELSSSFFEAGHALLDELLTEFNVILKLHPLLEEENPAAFFALIEKYQEAPHLCLLKAFPPVYPLFPYADLYLGDLSSVGYDFLTTDKPLYFLPWKGEKRPLLYDAGMELRDLKFLHESYEENLKSLSEARRSLAAYAFGELVPIQVIKHSLERSL